MKRLCMVFAVMMLFQGSACVLRGFAEEVIVASVETEEEVSGRITNIDTENSMISLKVYTDDAEDAFSIDEMYVLHEAVIKKNGEIISFNDLKTDDIVTVRYQISPEGRKEIKNIWVKNSAIY